jgi:hypothetical protein
VREGACIGAATMLQLWTALGSYVCTVSITMMIFFCSLRLEYFSSSVLLVCVYYSGTYYKAVREGGGRTWLRDVWTSGLCMFYVLLQDLSTVP